jgi:hypothetical protein
MMAMMSTVTVGISHFANKHGADTTHCDNFPAHSRCARRASADRHMLIKPLSQLRNTHRGEEKFSTGMRFIQQGSSSTRTESCSSNMHTAHSSIMNTGGGIRVSPRLERVG